MRLFVALVVSLVILAPPAFAQITSATISGIIKDATGGVLSGVDIVVSNVVTRLFSSADTNGWEKMWESATPTTGQTRSMRSRPARSRSGACRSSATTTSRLRHRTSTTGPRATTSRTRERIQAGLLKRLSGGHQVQLSYTFSKTMDNGDAQLGMDTANSTTYPPDPYDLDAEWAVAAFDARPVFSANLRGSCPRFGRIAVLSGNKRLQIRLEVFNVLNRANFATPTRPAFAGANQDEAPLPTAGRILRTVNSSRQIQLGVKFLS